MIDQVKRFPSFSFFFLLVARLRVRGRKFSLPEKNLVVWPGFGIVGLQGVIRPLGKQAGRESTAVQNSMLIVRYSPLLFFKRFTVTLYNICLLCSLKGFL